MMDATDISDVRLQGARDKMREHWTQAPKMELLARRIKDGVVTVHVLPPDKHAQGLHFQLTPYKLFISENALDEDDLTVALVIFAEFQHSPGGGGLGEEDAQIEFEWIRNQLPWHLRTPFINDLHHEGTENDN